MDLLETLKLRRRKQAASAMQEYQQLIVNVADGRRVDADKAAGTLDATGKTEVDLEADVARFLHRREQSALAAEVPALDALLPKIDSDIAAELDRFKPIEEAHEQKLYELTRQKREALQRLEQANNARAELIADARDPEVIAARDQLTADLQALYAQQSGVERTIDNLERVEAICQSNIAKNERRALGPDRELTEQLESARERLKKLRDERRRLNDVTVPVAQAALRDYERKHLTSPAA